MEEFTNPNLINEDAIDNLTDQQVDELLAILSKL
jgi:hypothetical protein